MAQPERIRTLPNEPVGHIWKFDLEQHKKHDFELKGNFSKNRVGHVMLKFFAIIENAIIIKSEEPIYNRCKVVKKSSGKLLFAISSHRNIPE